MPYMFFQAYQLKRNYTLRGYPILTILSMVHSPFHVQLISSSPIMLYKRQLYSKTSTNEYKNTATPKRTLVFSKTVFSATGVCNLKVVEVTSYV